MIFIFVVWKILIVSSDNQNFSSDIKKITSLFVFYKQSVFRNWKKEPGNKMKSNTSFIHKFPIYQHYIKHLGGFTSFQINAQIIMCYYPYFCHLHIKQNQRKCNKNFHHNFTYFRLDHISSIVLSSLLN